jgi:branched-chain amino acid transport system ATP-binding protein
VLELTDVAAHYGRSQALFRVSLTVRAGEAVAVLGPNAAGKSTTLKCISRLMRQSGGSITFEGTSTARWSSQRMVAEGVVQVPEGRQLFPFMSVQENLDVGAYNKRARREWRRSLDEVFEWLPLLRERRTQLAGTLSGGEQQMVAIGRAMMARPRLLMLDEPSLGLSPIMVQRVFSIIKGLKETGLTILLVEQNMAQALRVVDRAYVLNTGVTVMEADAAAMRSDPAMRRAYLGLESAGEETAAPAVEPIDPPSDPFALDDLDDAEEPHDPHDPDVPDVPDHADHHPQETR